jgi:hypothetical protein
LETAVVKFTPRPSRAARRDLAERRHEQVDQKLFRLLARRRSELSNLSQPIRDGLAIETRDLERGHGSLVEVEVVSRHELPAHGKSLLLHQPGYAKEVMMPRFAGSAARISNGATTRPA